MIIMILLWVTVAYIIGAFPTGYLVARYKGIRDITAHGSGTIGATNVARQLGFFYFILVFLIDALKAALVLLIAPCFLQPMLMVVLVLGNSYSLFIGCNGGKGVATLVGILCIVQFRLALLFIALWMSFLTFMPIVGFASLVALTGVLVSCVFFMAYDWYVCMLMVIIVWILYRHKEHMKKIFSWRKGLNNEF